MSPLVLPFQWQPLYHRAPHFKVPNLPMFYLPDADAEQIQTQERRCEMFQTGPLESLTKGWGGYFIWNEVIFQKTNSHSNGNYFQGALWPVIYEGSV